MMLTENEAARKWCPFARVAGTLSSAGGSGIGGAGGPPVYDTMRGAAINRDPIGGGDSSPDGRCKCLASGCMAWRWQSSASMDNPSRVPGAGTQEIKQERGFCGLAGRP